MLFPEGWSYELIEAWYPGTAWNPNRSMISMGGDYEPYNGRRSYAKIGGCYYAARLATAEYLLNEERQAAVLILRESYPEYVLPMGVWLVRESVRRAFKSYPLKFQTQREMLEYVASRLKIGMRYWIETSQILQRSLYQKKINEFLNGKQI